MELTKAIYSRKSVRSFSGEALKKEEIDAFLKAAFAAPVGGARYDAMHLTVVTDKEVLESVKTACSEMFGDPNADPLHNAPLLIVVSASEEVAADVASANTGAIVENMQLAAVDMGIGSLFVWGGMAAVRNSEEALKKFKLPEGHTIYGSFAAGYMDGAYEEREIPSDKISVSYL